MRENNKGITLVTLIITIIIMLILTGVVFSIVIGDNGIFQQSKSSTQIYDKEEAKETMNMKITGLQMENYIKNQRLPSLQELADGLCEDEEMEYVLLESKATASLNKVTVGEKNSIFTKIKKYPYEFEINRSLQLASIDGEKISNTTSDEVTISKQEYDTLINRIEKLEKKKTIGGSTSIDAMSSWDHVRRRIQFEQPLESANYNVTITRTSLNARWAFIEFAVTEKTVDGFLITAYCSTQEGTAAATIDWKVDMLE